MDPKPGTFDAAAGSNVALIAELGPDILSVLDAEGRLVYNSPQAARIHGWDPSEMIGRNTMDYIHPDDVPAVDAAFAQLFTNPSEPVLVRYRYRHKSGGWTQMEATGRNLLADPRVNGIVAVSRDVTPREVQAPIRVPRGSFDPARAVVETPEGDVSLTPIEARALAYLAARPGEWVRPERLLEEVWGYSRNSRSRTVYATIDRLRRKIGHDPHRPAGLLSRRQSGYAFAPSD